MIVKSVNECRIHQSLGPNHGGWLDKVSAHHTSYAKANALCGDGQHDIKSPAKILVIKSPLCNEGISEVADAISESSISHDHDESMLLHVEGTRLQTPLPTKRMEGMGWHYHIPANSDWVCDHLYDNRRDCQGRGAKGEERVQAGCDGRQQHPNHPGPDSVAREIFIIIPNRCSNLTIVRNYVIKVTRDIEGRKVYLRIGRVLKDFIEYPRLGIGVTGIDSIVDVV